MKKMMKNQEKPGDKMKDKRAAIERKLGKPKGMK